jgi:hypothetical protein
MAGGKSVNCTAVGQSQMSRYGSPSGQSQSTQLGKPSSFEDMRSI